MPIVRTGLLRGFLRRRRPRLHNLHLPGLNSKYRNDLEQGGGAKVVKGTARRVIVVKSPEAKIFEEAIFIIREDAISENGVSAARLLEEAHQIAAGYSQRRKAFGKLFSRRLSPAVAAAGGAAVMGIAWLLMQLLA